MGTDHSLIGAKILEKWGLPRSIVLAAQHHHAPNEVEDGAERTCVDVIHVANAIAQSMGHGSDLGALGSNLSVASLLRLDLSEENLEQAMVESHDSIQHFGSVR
jgi:HD-like signal output (HDOD) protein